jgi:hypothetical protein
VGLVVGEVATVPMSGFFLLAQKAGMIGELPPRKLAQSLLPELSSAARKRAGMVAHRFIGGAAGALYLTIFRRRPRTAVTGAAFGIGVWLVGYELAVPSLTSMPKAHRDRRSRAISILVAHLVYGASLGLAAGAVSGRPGPLQRRTH